MAHSAVKTNLVTTASVLTTAAWTSDAISPAAASIGVQAWAHITATYGSTPAGNTMVRTKFCPLVGAVLFDDGPDIPFTVTAATTYNVSIMLPQLSQSFKIVVTNDTNQTLTLSVDIEYIEVS